MKYQVLFLQQKDSVSQAKSEVQPFQYHQTLRREQVEVLKKISHALFPLQRGSCYEAETQLIVAIKLKFIQGADNAFGIIEELQKMLYRFYMKLQEDNMS